MAVDDHQAAVLVDGDATRVLVVAAQRRDVVAVRPEDLDLFRAAVAHGDVAVLEHAHVEGTAERRAAVVVAAAQRPTQGSGRVKHLHAAVLPVEDHHVAVVVHVDAGRVDILDVGRRRAVEAAHHLHVIAHRQRRHRVDGFLTHGLHRLAVERHVVNVQLAVDRTDGVQTGRAWREVDTQLRVDRMRGEVRGHLEALQHQFADVEDLLRPAEVQQLLRDDGGALELLERVTALRVPQVGPLSFLARRRHQRVDHDQFLLVDELVQVGRLRLDLRGELILHFVDVAVVVGEERAVLLQRWNLALDGRQERLHLRAVAVARLLQVRALVLVVHAHPALAADHLFAVAAEELHLLAGVLAAAQALVAADVVVEVAVADLRVGDHPVVARHLAGTATTQCHVVGHACLVSVAYVQYEEMRDVHPHSVTVKRILNHECNLSS